MTAFDTFAVIVVGGTGVALVGMGLFLIVKALQARAELTATLVEEGATTPSGPVPAPPSGGSGEVDVDAPPLFSPSVPVQPIRNAFTARMRIDEITARTTKSKGTWQSLPEGPERQWFINGLAIRTGLGLAVLGYGVANIALALGTALVLVGGLALAVGVPLILRS